MNKEGLSLYLTTRDHLVSGESFDLMYDPEMEMLCTTPVPSNEDMPKYYESEDYISHTDSGKGLMAYLYQRVKSYALKKKVKLITRQNRGAGSLLDIGAGTGAFLEAASRKGWKVKGVEPSDKARKFAAERGLELVNSINELDEYGFDVITLWHVLEHVPDLQKIIRDLSLILKPGGSIIIAVPNFKSYDARYYKKFWAAYDVPRHLWHFSRNLREEIIRKRFHLCKR